MQIQTVNSLTAKSNIYQTRLGNSQSQNIKSESQPSFQGEPCLVMRLLYRFANWVKSWGKHEPRIQSQKEFRESRNFDDVP